MSEFPSLPLFTDAFIADTGHLNATETGAYLMLLMVAWRTPVCCLPDDDQRLARWARVDARSWSRIKPKVMEFWDLTDGQWTQKRLLLERDKVRKYAEASRRNGAAGGRPKSLKTNGGGNPAGSPGETQQKAPNPNPNPNKSLQESARAHTREGLEAEFEVFWSAYPHQVGKPAALEAYVSARSRGSPHDEIVEGARHYWRTKPPDRQWLNPSTFLAEQRWLDKPAPAPTGPSLTVVNGVKHHAPAKRTLADELDRIKQTNPLLAGLR